MGGNGEIGEEDKVNKKYSLKVSLYSVYPISLSIYHSRSIQLFNTR